jgi:hypothetical protein
MRSCKHAQLTAMPNDTCAAEVDMFKWMSHASLECISIGGLGHSFKADTAYRHAAEDLAYMTSMCLLRPVC